MSARFSESVFVWTMFGRVDAVQDHVHYRDDVRERLLLLAVEGAHLQRLELARAQLPFPEVIVRFAEEAR
jgi:hypothetical protein